MIIVLGQPYDQRNIYSKKDGKYDFEPTISSFSLSAFDISTLSEYPSHNAAIICRMEQRVMRSD